MSLHLWWCRGHPNILANHEGTLEITSDNFLTPRGECIIGIAAKYLGGEGKDSKGAFSKLIIIALPLLPREPMLEKVYGLSSGMANPNARRLIVRKSAYIDDKTIMVSATKAASDLNKKFKEAMRSPFTRCLILYTSINGLQG
ncbi:MAG: DUF371 domain-containing protein [Pyrodictiaceae archaeon]